MFAFDPERAIEVTLRARYAETDAMGVVHHASYVAWLELGRVEFLRAVGASYREIEARGFFIVLSDLQLRYHASARFDDLVLVRTSLAELRSRQVSFAYELRLAETGVLLVSAVSRHIVVARESSKPTRFPQDLVERLQPLRPSDA